VLEGTALSLFCLLIAYFVLKLWKADLRVPFDYAGDGNFIGMLAKGILDNGWFQRNPSLGAPFGQALYDFPMGADNVHLLAMKLLSLVFHDFGRLINVYYVLTYPMTVLTAYFVLRHMGRARLTAAVFAVLFGFLPYHLNRGLGHLLLSSYEAVPLGALLLYWQSDRQALFFRESHEGFFRGFTVRRRRAVAAIVIAFLIGGMGAYYAVFAAVTLLALAVVLAFSRSWRKTISSAFLAVLIAASVLANLAPSIAYTARNGQNPETGPGRRLPVETEYYGLKLAQIVLPVEGHRIRPLADLQQRSVNTSMPSERGQAIGIVATAGLVALLLGGLGAMAGSRRREKSPAIRVFTFGTVTAILVATVGGISLVLALGGLSQIRAWNRISVYLAFYSLAALALWAERLKSRAAGRLPARRTAVAYGMAMVAVLAIGLFDQTPAFTLKDYGYFRSRFANDKAFIGSIEARLGSDAAVFQLPFAPFPEAGPIHDMADYDHLRGYLHSKGLRWSYAGIRGREGDWQGDLASRSVWEVSIGATLTGFDGLYIDRSGYSQAGRQVEQEASAALGAPIVSRDQRLLFYDLRPLGDRLRRRFDSGLLGTAQRQTLHPLDQRFTAGFFGPESDGVNSWRWTSGRATLELYNPLSAPRRVTLKAAVQTAGPGTHQLQLSVWGTTRSVPISLARSDIQETLELRPGRNTVVFSSDAPGFDLPAETRDLRFRLADLDVTDEAFAAVSRL